MRKIIFCLLSIAMLNIAYGAEERKDFIGLKEQTWICPNKIETVMNALAQIPLNHTLVAVDPKYFTFNSHSWNLLLVKARKFDMLVDENESSVADSNGIKQARDGLFLISNTLNSNVFVEEWFKQTQAKAIPTNGHPTLFSSILSDLRNKNKGFRVSGLVWPLPLDWSAKLAPGALPIVSTLQRLKVPAHKPAELYDAESVRSLDSPLLESWEEFVEDKDD